MIPLPVAGPWMKKSQGTRDEAARREQAPRLAGT